VAIDAINPREYEVIELQDLGRKDKQKRISEEKRRSRDAIS